MSNFDITPYFKVNQLTSFAWQSHTERQLVENTYYYYPAEFLCALLNNQPLGFYAPHGPINEAERRGIRVLRPDLNASQSRSSVVGRRSVRIGLAQIKGISEDAAERLLDARRQGGDYRSLADLVRRASLSHQVIEQLILAGALDGLGLQRRELLWHVGLFIPARALRAGMAGTRTEGKQLALNLPTAQDHVDLTPMPAWQRMADEYWTVGVSPHYHPFQLLRPRLDSRISTSTMLGTLPHGFIERVAGLVVCRQRPGTAKGITFLLMEDETGLTNVVVYPDLYEGEGHVVRAQPMVIVEGRLQHLNGNINILASAIWPLASDELAPPLLDTAEVRMREDVDPRVVQLGQPGMQLPQDDLATITPLAHNYR